MSLIASGSVRNNVLTQGTNKIRLMIKPGALLILLIGIALVYWLWFGISQRSIDTDDGISILAAKGILQHGYPLMPSGKIFRRGIIPNYLVAGSIQIFGLNDFAIMLPGLILELATLWLMFLFAKQVLGNGQVGVASAVILLFLSSTTFYATSPRMYGTFIFLSLLAAYSGWRGYYRNETRFQWATGLAITAAVLTHEFAVLSALAIPLSVLIVSWFYDRKFPRLNALPTLSSFFLYARPHYSFMGRG